MLFSQEGTRITQKKLEEARKFSKENNLPVFKNLLVPKTKGSWMITKHLAETKRLGKIWDITMAVPAIINGRNAHLEDILHKQIGPIYTDIRELKINDEYKEMDTFKQWFLKQWVDKDNFMSNYKQYNYELIKFEDQRYHHMTYITFICILGILLLSKKMSRYYLLLMIAITYIVIGFEL